MYIFCFHGPTLFFCFCYVLQISSVQLDKISLIPLLSQLYCRMLTLQRHWFIFCIWVPYKKVYFRTRHTTECSLALQLHLKYLIIFCIWAFNIVGYFCKCISEQLIHVCDRLLLYAMHFYYMLCTFIICYALLL